MWPGTIWRHRNSMRLKGSRLTQTSACVASARLSVMCKCFLHTWDQTDSSLECSARGQGIEVAPHPDACSMAPNKPYEACARSGFTCD